MEIYNFPHVVPQLVEDNSLKRARTEVGGEAAIRVTTVGDTPVDLTPITDALGTTSDTTSDSTVIGLLKSNDSNQSSIKYDVGNCSNDTHYIRENTDDIPQIKNDVSDTKDLIQLINSTAGYIDTNTSNTNTVLGTISSSSAAPDVAGPINGRIRHISEVQGKTLDVAWSGSGSGSLIAIAKRTSNDTHAVADVLGTQSDSLVTLQDGTISARLRGLTSLTSTINSNTSSIKSYTNSIDTLSGRISNATGTQSDAAWSGTGDGSVIALLKGIYNKL